MNGHLYLRQNVTRQRRVALLVSEGKSGWGATLDNVKRDAEAWRRFLERDCHFETIVLQDPTLEAFHGGLRQLRTKLHEQRTGRLALPIQRVAITVEKADDVVLPNTLALFFFAGVGAYERGRTTSWRTTPSLTARATCRSSCGQ